MDYRTIDDMYERATLVRLTDTWTPGLGRYRDRAAVVIDIEVLGYPRTISRQENGNTHQREIRLHLHRGAHAG